MEFAPLRRHHALVSCPLSITANYRSFAGLALPITAPREHVFESLGRSRWCASHVQRCPQISLHWRGLAGNGLSIRHILRSGGYGTCEMQRTADLLTSIQLRFLHSSESQVSHGPSLSLRPLESGLRTDCHTDLPYKLARAAQMSCTTLRGRVRRAPPLPCPARNVAIEA
ncbi:hypothetical protein BD324DRAFT_627862 [Kockovaella imperatae]|uniref:Uncharacterized protein n=1 Tax=Kockovaella imperatae TaxID=4999 RepID=A0A1Y1UGK9_9TREE|nr:hypothetical protein BD324DRAFT_627862 [Kockovaella imperatae]ORX36205.1 hypothetical protein BD324DRAFT_627862 [Kockovaella imperatae]